MSDNEPKETRVPLKEPLPLGLCPNVPPPGRCGHCWQDLAAEALRLGKQPWEMEALVKRGAKGGGRWP